MAFRVQISGVDQVTGEIREAVLSGETAGMEAIGLRGQVLVMNNWPVGATGIGAHSVAWQFRGERSEKVVSIFEGAPADVYARPVELGAKPHFPPTEALLLWVKHKLNPANDKEALSIAFAIAKTIAKRGTPGRHMFERALAQLEPEVQPILERYIADALQRAGFAGAA